MKLRLDNRINYIDNKDFKTIQIRVLFHFKEKQEELALSTLLPNLLNYMNEDYPTEDSFKRAKLDKYILNTSCGKNNIGLESCISLNLVIPDIDTLKEDLLEEQFKLFEGFIYRPLIINNGFSEFELNREKENLKNFIDNSYKNLRPYLSIKIRELIDDQNILSMDIARNIDLIDKVNPKNLYDFYNKVITNNNCIVFVMGNFNHKKMDKLINKYILRDNNKVNLDVEYDYFLKVRDKVNIVNEKSHFKDSALSIVYKIKDMNEKDKIPLIMLQGLLGSQSSRLLNKKLRDEEELVYSSFATHYPHYGCLELNAFINKHNKDIVYNKLLEVISDLKNEELISPLLENLKERKRISLIRNLDNKYSIFDEALFYRLGIDEIQEDVYKKMLKITSKDISNLVDRLVLDTVYFIEEEDK